MNKNESKYFNTAVRMDKALIELLEKKDFEYITIKEICQAAGVNRSTFYLHYENGVLFSERKTVRKIKKDLFDTMKESREITYEEWLARPVSMKIKQAFLNLFSTLM